MSVGLVCWLGMSHNNADVSTSLCTSKTGGRDLFWWQHGLESSTCATVPQRWEPEDLCYRLQQPPVTVSAGDRERGPHYTKILSTPSTQNLYWNWYMFSSKMLVPEHLSWAWTLAHKHHSSHTQQQKVQLQFKWHRWMQEQTVSDCGFRLWFCTTCVKGELFAQASVKVCQLTEPGGLLEWKRDRMWGMQTNI